MTAQPYCHSDLESTATVNNFFAFFFGVLNKHCCILSSLISEIALTWMLLSFAPVAEEEDDWLDPIRVIINVTLLVLVQYLQKYYL